MRCKNGFYDLSVTVSTKPHLVHVLTTLIELGYRTVALNTIVEESAFDVQGDRKKKRKAEDTVVPIPPPLSLDDIPEEIKNSLRILHRVTVCFSSPDIAHKMISLDNFKKYDILAVIPKTQAAVQHTCNALDIDIISYDPSNKMPVRWNRKLYNMATEKGIWFELPYALAVLDSNARRNLIEVGHSYHAFGKSKNIIISSGAQNPMQVRGPYDVISLSLLLGLSEEQAKSAISNAGRSILFRAESRRRGKSVVCIEAIASSLTREQDNDVMEFDQTQPTSKKLCVESGK